MGLWWTSLNHWFERWHEQREIIPTSILDSTHDLSTWCELTTAIYRWRHNSVWRHCVPGSNRWRHSDCVWRHFIPGCIDWATVVRKDSWRVFCGLWVRHSDKTTLLHQTIAHKNLWSCFAPRVLDFLIFIGNIWLDVAVQCWLCFIWAKSDLVVSQTVVFVRYYRCWNLCSWCGVLSRIFCFLVVMFFAFSDWKFSIRAFKSLFIFLKMKMKFSMQRLTAV